MTRKISRRQFARLVFASGVGATTAGCGTLMYPERRGQPPGPLDWSVVGMDAIGLIFFFVPGVIAFAVDFITGAIYLPPGQYSAVPSNDPNRQLVSVNVPPGQLSNAQIEQVVSKHVGQPVLLVDGGYQTQPIESIDHFWQAHDQRVSQ